MVKETNKETDTAPKVYQAMSAVQAEISSLGISKSRKNVQQGYAFRGIDEIYNTLAPIFAKHKLLIIPNVLSREVSERTTKRGDALFSVVVNTEFTFVSAEDGSTVKATTYGEAMDTADKATNKAMSAAYKYVCLQAFAIPTAGDNDADATTHEVAPRKPAPVPAQAKPAPKVAPAQPPADPFEGLEKAHADALKKAQTPTDLLEIIEGVKMQMGDAFKDVRNKYTEAYKARLREIQGAKK
ncbi:MAG: ERF family protein [Elusimicrobiaceae bacterium]|nr:ERF family protein [Elusimicrobiaceae bacterium]